MYNKIMENLTFDQDQEIIITVGDLTALIHGLGILSRKIEEIQDKIPDEDNMSLFSATIGMFIQIAKLFPPKDQKEIFKALKEQVGLDVEKILR